ncbi:hypothetical protein DEO72_LG9g1817 [Vigna unguiculata]|uniref:Uncharacterized protein n=1 Tax=Vigna unguiculata TaxID=3917 RepID=A0A4D6MZ66_VIGUN|nr:hypothetical protein DEO72_LG9g1817 [Vigna unguiculata]
MNEIFGRDHSHRSSAHPNPRLGLGLLGFTKPARNQSKPSENLRNQPFRCVSLALCEIQSVERRLGKLFRQTPRRRSLIKWYSEPLGSRSVAR